MPLDKSVKKVLVIGSGPITIGQAAEFDYAGTQACKALREEGISVVLVNSNPATIMTDVATADSIYIEPLNTDSLERILKLEMPDAILPTLGGQTGLNLAVKLSESGVLDKLGIKLLGTNLDSIKKSEDRDLFKTAMNDIGEPVAESIITSLVEEAVTFAEKIGYPVIIRPAYTLGGTGGGVAKDKNALEDIARGGIAASPVDQILVEKSLMGWKEIEFEVMRDSADNCITICNMENFDPVGVHTGDSIVAVPTQTLTDKENQMLRSASINIIRKMKIQGGCNVQFALDTASMSYFVIEVNPRVSRSSALASKATGYPIARLAAKIALGYTLDELKNPVTGVSSAFFEPVIDYVVVKIPKWPFDKFTGLSRKLNTQMKATGEVMAMDRSFEGALLKAVRALEMDNKGLYLKQIKSMGNQELLERLKNPDDLRIWIIAEAARRKWRKEFIEEISGVNKWFISKLFNIVEFENVLREAHLNEEIIRIAKKMGFSDEEIGFFAERSPEDVKSRRLELGIIPSTKPVDTCSGEFDSVTAYYYNTYNGVNEINPIEEKNVLVLGSGPIRIGQGIEFDYCAVHSAQAVKKLGIKSIMLNNNPETVSTDYDCSDRLYFEPITFEDAMNIIEKEKPEGVLVQFGGQTAIKMAGKLHKAGVKILGTSYEGIDLAEDRKKFDYLMEQLGIRRPKGTAASDLKEAIEIAKKLGYPLMVRPSYVIGGQNMLVVHNTNELLAYLDGKIITDREPLLMDEYIVGIEVEIDALCDGERVFIPGIMEHIEPTGVHSGDSMSVYPSMNLSDEIKKELVKVTKSLGIALSVKGHLNVQFAVRGTEVFVIEANPRASRTIPIISKIAAFPMVEIATGIALGKTLPELGVHEEYKEPEGIFAVKAPVFSFEKLSGMDCVLGPEMKSTGEVLGVSSNYEEALAKAFIAVGASYTKKGKFLAGLSGSTEAWEDGIKGLTPLGFDFVDLKDVLKENPNLETEDRDQFKSYLINNGYSYFISDSRADITHRKWAVEAGVQCFTSPATLAAFAIYWNYIAKKGELTPYKFSLN